MCGRYYRRSDRQKIAETFHVHGDLSSLVLADDYNIAPTTFQPVIRNDKEAGDRELVMMRWGLIPNYTRNLSELKPYSTINARAESLMRTPTWVTPFQAQRCLIPMDGFYEWKKLDAKTRQPFGFTLQTGEPFALAGLWDAWKEPDGGWLQSYSIITTEANELMSPVHNRMPVILHPADYSRWLDREVSDQPPIDLLRPFESEAMQSSPVNQKVGNVRNNGPEMLNSA